MSIVVTRRHFLRSVALVGAASLVSACTPAPPPQSPPPTSAPTTQPAPAQAQAPAPTQPAKPATTTAPVATAAPAAAAPAVAKPDAAADGLKPVPANRTFTMIQGGMNGKHVDHELWNPYAVGANHQNGPNLFFEPLAYYSAFADKETLWLAESYQYSPDFKTLTIKTRSGITWSDGKPFSAEDVAYTFTKLKELGPQVRWGADVQLVLDEARALDADTVQLKFKVPAPRFFYFVTYKYDIGVYIVPKHIFEGQDWTSFKDFDLAKDWPVTTGPWKLVAASPEQKIYDRRDSWWAATRGLLPMPKVERIIHQPSVNEQTNAQALITGAADYSGLFQPSTILTIVKGNPNIVTFSGKEAPFGSQDWFPHGLFLNNEVPPYDDPDVRWAFSYFIDRDVLVDIGWSGMSAPIALPMPTYPGLMPFYDAAKPLLDKYPTNEFNPQKGEQLLQKKGWKKDAQGMWIDAGGQPVKLEILVIASATPLGPVVVELLKQQGIDASFSQPPDINTRYSKGQYVGAIWGHGGSVGQDPYFTLKLYQTSSTALPGDHSVNFSKWKNEKYDKIVDEMYATSPNDRAKVIDLFKQAMEIWLPELPDVQLTQNIHRIAMNTTRWRNFPTADNPYLNPAVWHLTHGYMVTQLEPVQ
jgi:peptide/nickel transport system substrate-binding protein